MTRIRWYGPTLVLLATILLVMIAGPKAAQRIAWAQTDAKLTLIRNELSQNPVLAELSTAFRQVAQAVEPSVVSIEVLRRREAESPQERMMRRWFFGPEGPDLEEFFGPPQQRRPDQDRERDEEEFRRYNPALPYGNGSGWVYDSQGHIITNNHVIEGADEIQVHFADGTQRTATVVGVDPNTDVAVLKVDADNLHPASIATGPVEKGDIVFAFGSPFRFDFSMSQGIVSATGRKHLGILGPSGYENFIQTDAAINPGNSGGPLTNIYGQVVGMNTAIVSRALDPRMAGNIGIGFAIPVDMVVDVADEIIRTGRVRRGYLGVYIDDLTPQMARTFNYEGTNGALVVDPIPGSPGAKAGLQAGDIITQVNGQSIRSANELRYRIASLEPGSQVKLTVFREGQTRTIEVTLEELPGPQASQQGPPGEPGPSTQAVGMQTLRKLGIEEIQAFTPGMAQELGVDHVPGVLIESVRPNSIAAVAGLDRGTIILQVMGQDVASPQDLISQVEKFEPGQAIRLRVAQWNPRDKSMLRRFVVLELPAD
ncbi:MAG TPA: trypsin-like peptidase domain-containing protein [Phycisphaeraceae bacterium]